MSVASFARQYQQYTWQIILRSVLGMYVHLITHSTRYAICHTNYPRLAPSRVHSITSRATAYLTWRSCVGANNADVKTLSLCLVWSRKFHLLGVTLIWVYGLNLPEVEKLFLSSLSSFLIWTSRLKSNTTFNWTCIISLSQHSTPTEKDSVT